MERLQSVQILRAVAALMVVVMHAFTLAGVTDGDSNFTLGPAQMFGAAGVDIFFVISGFIICRQVLSGPSAKDFYQRRFTRVVPIYLLVSAPFALMQSQDAMKWLATLLFVPNLQPHLSVGWTLAYEMVFYTSVALCMLFRRWWPLAGLLAISGLFLEFFFGAAISLMRPRITASIGAMLAIAGFCGLGLAALQWDAGLQAAYDITWAQEWGRAALYGPLAAIVVFGALATEPWVKGRARILGYLGDASYSIYLIHILVLRLLYPVFQAHPAPAPVVIVAGTLISIAAGICLYRLVEQPMLRAMRGHAPKPISA